MTSAALQIAALLTMLVDHLGYALFPGEDWMRMIGRLSFPLFAFMLSEGFINTKNRRNYVGRLAVFALLSEIPYRLFARHSLSGGSMFSNIFYELLLIFLALACLELAEKQRKYLVLGSIAALAVAVSAELLSTMYGAYGVLMAIGFYVFRKRPWAGQLCLILLTAVYCLYKGSWFQIYAAAAAIPLFFYNGQRGRRLPRYFGYVFYPAHLLLIYGVYHLQRFI
mgnify:CR=1 FL=1